MKAKFLVSISVAAMLALSAAAIPTTASAASTVTTIKVGKSAKVLLDGKQRLVGNKCLAGPDLEHPWCFTWGVKVNKKTKLKNELGPEGELVSQTVRAVKVTSKTGLLAVTLERPEGYENPGTENTRFARVYRYKNSKLIKVRNLLADHLALHGPALEGGYAPSHIRKISTLGGAKFKVTWQTVDWGCSNDRPTITYKYTGGKVKVVSHTHPGTCD